MSYELRNLLDSASSCLGLSSRAWPYIPHEKKLDSKTVSCFFVGYSERSRGFRFYCPSTKNIIETDNAKFIEDIQNSESQLHKDFIFEEKIDFYTHDNCSK